MSETGTRRFFPIAAAFYLVLAIAGIVGLGAQRGALGPEVWIDAGSWGTDFGIGLGLGALLLGLWAAAVRWAPGALRLEAELRARLGPIRRSEAVALAVVSALAEEVAFRGALQSWVGWLPAAILFALAHWAPPRHFRWWTLWALAGGLLLGWVTLERGTLAAAIVAHLTVNTWQLVRLARHARGDRRQAAAAEPAVPAPVAPSGPPAGPTPEPATDEIPEEVLAGISREEVTGAVATEDPAEPAEAAGEGEATAPPTAGTGAPSRREEEWR